MAERAEGASPSSPPPSRTEPTRSDGADAALTEARELVATVFEASPIGLELYDKNAVLIRANRKVSELFGADANMFLGKYTLKMDPNYQDPDVWKRLERGETVHHETVYDPALAPYPTTKTEVSHFSVSMTPIPDEVSKTVGFVMQFIDITERKRAETEKAAFEARFHRAQKMEAIGTLAGGVAHDFNNILGGLLGGLSLLEHELGEAPQQVRSDIEDMKALVQRGADLAKQLLGFSRQGKYDVRALDLEKVVRQTSTLFCRTQRDVTMHLEFEPGLKAAMMDHTQLEQVLLNLFVNSAHAMPGGGRITVRARGLTVDEPDARRREVAPGEYLELVVADSGIGMDAATMERIFEPFFTTKEPGVGTGLGLASVYGIVKNHGGAVTVASQPSQGATFTLLVPSTDAAVPESRRDGATKKVRRRGTVLVVDDEEPLLQMCARLLRSLGYETITARRGAVAIELLRANIDRVKAVVLDMTMPEMSGAKTLEGLRAVSPGVKVLLSSGYSADLQSTDSLRRKCDAFIQKPFDRAALADKLDELL